MPRVPLESAPPEPAEGGSPDPQLLRTERRLVRPGVRLSGLGLIPLIAGVLLLLLTSGVPWVLGIVLIALSLPIITIGISLLLGGGVAGWAARRWPFA